MSTLEGASLSTVGESLPPASAIGEHAANLTAGQASGANSADDQIDPQWSPGAQERIQQLIQERNAARERAALVDTYEPYKEVIDNYRARGINSTADLNARYEAQQQAEKAEAARQQRLQPIANQLLAKRDAGILEPEEAEQMWITANEAERIRDRNAVVEGKLNDIEIERLIEKPQFAKADPDYVRALVRGGMTPTEAVTRSHAKEILREQNVLAKYNGGKEIDAANHGNIPQGGGANGPSSGIGPPPDPQKDPAGFDKWWANMEAAGKRQ